MFNLWVLNYFKISNRCRAVYYSIVPLDPNSCRLNYRQSLAVRSLHGKLLWIYDILYMWNIFLTEKTRNKNAHVGVYWISSSCCLYAPPSVTHMGVTSIRCFCALTVFIFTCHMEVWVVCGSLWVALIVLAWAPFIFRSPLDLSLKRVN